MSRTLKELTGERPRCQYCGKEVKPRNQRVRCSGTSPKCPRRSRSCARCSSPSPTIRPSTWRSSGVMTGARVFRLRHRTSDFQSQKAYTAIHFWTGTYDAWGHQDARWLFCCMECGLSFGIAAYRAGYRMKGRTDA